MTHPIRNAEIHTFCRAHVKHPDEQSSGVEWVAMFYPYDTYPVHFRGPTINAVIEAAEAMRTEAIEKHEAACIQRQEASRRNKERAAKKRMEGAA